MIRKLGTLFFVFLLSCIVIAEFAQAEQKGQWLDSNPKIISKDFFGVDVMDDVYILDRGSKKLDWGDFVDVWMNYTYVAFMYCTDKHGTTEMNPLEQIKQKKQLIPDVYFNFEINKKGKTVSVKINGNMILSYEFEDFDFQGKMGLFVYNADVRFKDIIFISK